MLSTWIQKAKQFFKTISLQNTGMRDRSLPKQIDPYVDPDQQHLSPGMGNFVFSLTPFALIYPIFTCVDPDPYSEYESRRSTKMLNTDPIWIRIYNTDIDSNPKIKIIQYLHQQSHCDETTWLNPSMMDWITKDNQSINQQGSTWTTTQDLFLAFFRGIGWSCLVSRLLFCWTDFQIGTRPDIDWLPACNRREKYKKNHTINYSRPGL